MKTIHKIITATTLIIANIAVMSHCKSPATAKEEATVITADSAAVDSATAHLPIKDKIMDTVASRVPLTLIVDNLSSDTAPVIVGLYGANNKFPDPKDQMKEYKFKPHGKQLIAKIADLKFGVYALAIYQDVNSNGKIDKNMIGIPTEGYAFSNNYKPTVKAPAFNNCKFNYDSISNSVTMKIIR